MAWLLINQARKAVGEEKMAAMLNMLNMVTRLALFRGLHRGPHIRPVTRTNKNSLQISHKHGRINLIMHDRVTCFGLVSVFKRESYLLIPSHLYQSRIENLSQMHIHKPILRMD